jgi:hypothetical protein
MFICIGKIHELTVQKLDFDRLGGNFVVVVDVEPAAAATKPWISVTASEFSAKGGGAGMSLRIIN